MRKEVITRTLYNYNELSQQAQEKAIENLYNINVDHEWYDYTINNWKEKLEKIGFEGVEIFFSGFSSQGDGACFDGYVSIDKITQFTKDKEYKHLNYAIDKNLVEIEGINVKTSYANHYSHEKTRYFELTAHYYNYNGKINRIENLIEKLEKEIENLRYNLSCELYQELNKDYDYLTSKEAIIETIEANEYEFTKEGTLA